MHLRIYFCCTSSKETSKTTQNCHSPKMPLDSCLSVLVKLYNICGYKILTRFCFKGVNKLREFLKKRGRRHIQDPVKRLGWIIFVKIKAIWTKDPFQRLGWIIFTKIKAIWTKFCRTLHIRCLRRSLARRWLFEPKSKTLLSQILTCLWKCAEKMCCENVLLHISPYSVRMRENTDQKNLRIWTLFTQCHCQCVCKIPKEQNVCWKMIQQFYVMKL